MQGKRPKAKAADKAKAKAPKELFFDSRILGRKVGYAVYGKAGASVLLLPPAGGKARDFEINGAIDALRDLLDEKRVKAFAIDSGSADTWDDHPTDVPTRVEKLEKYYDFIMDEFMPEVMGAKKIRPFVAGVDRGATDAANLFFGWPQRFKGVIAVSGLYRTAHFFGPYMSPAVFRNSVLDSLADVGDDKALQEYLTGRILLCAGQHPHSAGSEGDTRALEQVLRAKNIPAFVDYWGRDVAPTWEWWNRQLPYLMDKAA